MIIAFLLPGFIFLWGLSLSVEPVFGALKEAATKEATVGAFLFVMLGSLAVGLVLSAFRWFVLDHVFKWMGIGANELNFDQIRRPAALTAFQEIVENHYRYYQYYANSLVAVAGALLMHVFLGKEGIPWAGWAITIAILLVLFLGARDALTKYYSRGSAVLGALKTGGQDD